MSRPPISFRRLLSDAAEMTAVAFLQRHPTPYLLVEVLVEETSDEWSFDTVAVAMPDLSGSGSGSGGGGGSGPLDSAMVFAVRKEGVESANLVTIGRTKTADIRLDSPAVSKLHAYFSRDPISGGYTLTDAGSTNGTVIADQRLEQGRAVALAGGEEIEIAGRFKATYLDPQRLLDMLQARLTQR